METKPTVPAEPRPSVTRFAPGPSGGRFCQLEIGGLPVQIQPRTAEDNDAAVRLANYLTSVTPPDPRGVEMSDVDRERMMNLELRDALVAGRKESALLKARVDGALAMLTRWAGHDGEHHRRSAPTRFALDQVARALTGCPADEDGVAKEETAEYVSFVAAYEDGDEGPKTYEWDTGVAP